MKVKSGRLIKQQMKFKWDVFLSCHSGGWIVTPVQVRNISVLIQAAVSAHRGEVLCNNATYWLKYVTVSSFTELVSLFFPSQRAAITPYNIW